jgi:hypothetical protein
MKSLRWCCLLVLLGAVPVWSAEGPPALRRVDVPADRPELWPAAAQSLVAVPRDEFDRLWEAAQPRRATPPAATLETADYDAVVSSREIRGGQCRWRIVRHAARPVWLELTPCNLALEKLAWTDGPAVWGADAAGRLWLWVDRTTGELAGEWSADGQSVADEITFPLAVPSALATRIILHAESSWRVECEHAVMQSRPANPDASGRTWELSLGSQTLASIKIRAESGAPPARLVTYRRQQLASIREDHLRFQTTLQAEVLDGEATELTLTVPAAVDVLSVSWSGDAPLRWTRARTPGPRDPVTVTLPDRFGGELRPIRVEGITPQRPGAPTGIPDVEIQDGVFRSGEVRVTVSRPLQVATIRTTGCRQQAPVVSSSEGEIYSFLQSRPESLLTFEVRRPRSQLTAQVLSAVTVRDEEWTQQTDVAWSSQSGTAFQLSLRVPAGWEVMDIDTFSAGGVPERTNWERLSEPDGSTRLAVELLEALSPETPRRMTIWSRRPPVPDGQTFEFPTVRPQDCQSVETVVAFATSARYWLSPTTGAAVEPVTADRLSEGWKSLPLWATLTSGPDPADAWFRAQGSDELGTLVLDGRPQPVDADVLCHAEVASGVAAETFTLQVRPLPGTTCDRVLVLLTEPGADPSWEVAEPKGLSLVSRRLAIDRHALPDLPNTGELWELRVPPVAVRELVLRGTRAQPLSLPLRLGLAVLPQARVASYRVVTESAVALGLQPVTQRLEEDLEQSGLFTSPSGQSLRRHVWRYIPPGGELSLAARRDGAGEAPGLSQLELRTLLAVDRESHDLHAASCLLPELERTIRLRLPEQADLLSAQLDGERLSASSDGVLSISPRRGTGPRRLELVYRSPQSGFFLRERRTLAALTADDLVWTGVRWEFFVPPGGRLDGEPAGVRLDQPLPATTWTTRLFGPLGRSSRESLFLPWSLSGWRGVLPASPPAARVVSPSETFPPAPPPDWKGYVAFAPAPTEVTVTIWHESRLRLLAWLGLLGTLITGVLLRLTGWGLRHHSTALWLALLGGLTLTLDGPGSEIVGGLIVGTVIGVMLPRRWLGWGSPTTGRPAVPMGSTQSFQLPPHAATAGTLLLSVFWLGGSPPSAQETPWPLESLLLVPVDAAGQPSQRVPLVYLHAAALEQLRLAVQPSTETPGWLLQSADYRATMSVGQRWPLTATFRVLVCDARETVSLPLRLAGLNLAGPQSCLVDNIPAAVTVQPDTGDLQVTWSRGPQPVSAIGELPLSTHVITLRLQAPWRRTPLETRLRLPIPAAGSSRLTVTTADDDGQTRSQTSLVGPVAFIEAGWIDTVATTLDAAFQIDVAEVWEVSAALLDVRSRSVLRPRSGQKRRFLLDLPPRSAVRNIRLGSGGRWQRLPGGQHDRRFLVEFADPLTEPATVEVDYVTPHATNTGEFLAQGLLWRSAQSRAVLPQSRLWAMAAASDLKVEPQSLENSGLVPVSRAAVQDALTGLLGDRTPQALYQVSGEAPVPFRWSTVTSRRRLLLWQQSGTVERDRLRWELEGDLEVQGAPVYSHVLSIDRRLRIEAISVRERGAERLVRWSESRMVGSPGSNRITLFLSDPCVETQRITLTASAAYSTEAPLPLPNIRCEDAELVGGRLLLSTVPELTAIWTTARGLRSLETGRAPTGPVSTQGVYDQTDADWRAILTVRPAALVQTPRILLTVQAAGDDSLRLTLRSQMAQTPEPTRAEWRLPAPWKLAAEPTPDRADLTADQLPDGSWSLSAALQPAASVGGGVWQFTANRSALSGSVLPLPHWLGTAQPETWLVDLTSPPVAPLVAEPSEPQSPAEWAQDWLAELVPMSSPMVRWFPHDSSLAAMPLYRPHASQSVSIAWLEHTLWRDPSGGAYGESVLRLAAPTTVISAQIPAGSRFLAARTDGREAVSTQSESTIRMAASDGGPFSELRLYWQQLPEPSLAPVAPISLAWPLFPGCSIGQQAIALFPTPTETLHLRERWTNGDWVDRALLRLETLSDHFAAAANPQSQQYLHREFLQGYALLAEKFGRRPQVLEQGGGQRVARWQAIVATTNRLRENSQPEVPLTTAPALGDQLADHPDVTLGMVSPAATQQSAWRIDRHWARWLLRCLLVLILLPLLRLVVRREWSEWLKAHPHAATALLGLVWWLCLSPSIVGFALVVWSAVRAVSVQRPIAAPAS